MGKVKRLWLSARFVLTAPTARVALWRLLYAVDVHTGWRRLPGNRRDS